MIWPPLLHQLTQDPVVLVDAELPGYALGGPSDMCFPALQSGSDAVALQGQLATGFSVDSRTRIAYFAAGLGYTPITRDVRVEGEVRSATLFAPRIEPASFASNWQIEAWTDKWGEIACFAAEEVSQHFGLIPPEILARMMSMILVRASARAAATAGAPTDVRSNMVSEDVAVLDQHNRHAGFFLTREVTLQHPMFDGGLSTPVKREVFVATDAAIVLPYDPIRDRVLLVEQFRMGPFGRGDPYPCMLEPVAGRVDPGEDPEATARRECVEEAGLSLDRLEHVSSHYCSPGCSTEYFHCYVGLCDLPDLSAGQGGLDSEDEDIRTHVLPFERAMDLIPSGEAANGPLVLCLLWLQRERQNLRAGV